MLRILLLVLCFTATIQDVQAARSETFEDVIRITSAEHYRRAYEYYHSESWVKAAKEFKILTTNFPECTYVQDARFFLGVSYYHLSELDLANDAFNQYLQCESNPKYFKECIDYKFNIAERFRAGEKRRLLCSKQMPKWASGYDLALEIYEEVIPAMPNDEIACKALYGKACILSYQRNYRESIDTFQALINRFPKSELAPECFLAINQVYLDQCRKEFQNPDLLALAEINLNRFEEQFPGEEKLENARRGLMQIKEVYAQGMYDTAFFYERIDQPRAAMIYYQKVIIDFPETHVAMRCRKRLSTFCPNALQEVEEYSPKTENNPFDEIPDDIQFSKVSEDTNPLAA